MIRNFLVTVRRMKSALDICCNHLHRAIIGGDVVFLYAGVAVMAVVASVAIYVLCVSSCETVFHQRCTDANHFTIVGLLPQH